MEDGTPYGDYLYYVILDDGTVEISDCKTSATEITIPSTIDGKAVTSIGERTFSWCFGLTSIKIPDSVTSIGEYAFTWCTSLTDVYYTGTEQQWEDIDINWRNPSFKNMTIHYNSKMPEQTPTPTIKPTTSPTPRPTTEPVDEVVFVGKYADNMEIRTVDNDDWVTFGITPLTDTDIPKELFVYVARYDEDGNMTEVSMTRWDFSDEGALFYADIPESGSYKIMIWDENNTPLIKALTAKPKESAYGRI